MADPEEPPVGECPGCDYTSGKVCDDCLDLLGTRVDVGDVMGGLLGCILIVGIVAAMLAAAFGWK